MAYKCENCHKGKVHGHMVSHAKNRLARLFIPNLQKLKVLSNGIVVRVKFCTSCIKRLRKEGRIGMYFVNKPVVVAVSVDKSLKKVKESLATVKIKEKIEKVQKVRETIDISAIVGKKS